MTFFSLFNISLTTAIYSLVFNKGFPYSIPCQPSTTCGPDTPKPSLNLPLDNLSIVTAVIALIAGVRPGICMMPAPSSIFEVILAKYESGVTAS